VVSDHIDKVWPGLDDELVEPACVEEASRSKDQRLRRTASVYVVDCRFEGDHVFDVLVSPDPGSDAIATELISCKVIIFEYPPSD
jgi:hypothetical protein